MTRTSTIYFDLTHSDSSTMANSTIPPKFNRTGILKSKHDKPGNQNSKLQRNERKGNVTPENEKQRKLINEGKGLFT